MDINDYISSFKNLNTAKRMGQIAPHKAIMLLSVIDLIESDVIKTPFFELTDKLESKFKELWKRYIGTSMLFKPVPATPFYHLNNEPFWNLYNREGVKIERMENTPSIGYLRSNYIMAAIDNELFNYMKSSDDRATMRTVLISTYLNQPKTNIRKVLPIVISIASVRLCV